MCIRDRSSLCPRMRWTVMNHSKTVQDFGKYIGLLYTAFIAENGDDIERYLFILATHTCLKYNMVIQRCNLDLLLVAWWDLLEGWPPFSTAQIRNSEFFPHNFANICYKFFAPQRIWVNRREQLCCNSNYILLICRCNWFYF